MKTTIKENKDLLNKRVIVKSLEDEDCRIKATIFGYNSLSGEIGIIADFKEARLVHDAFNVDVAIRTMVYNNISARMEEQIDIKVIEEYMFPASISLDDIECFIIEE